MDKIIAKERRMDLRDERVRLQRRLAALKDIEFWEPESLTQQQKHQMKALAYKITELHEIERGYYCA